VRNGDVRGGGCECGLCSGLEELTATEPALALGRSAAIRGKNKWNVIGRSVEGLLEETGATAFSR